MSGPSVYFSWPSSFQIVPDTLPQSLPPPIKERTLRAPFGIDKDLYNFALRPEVPLIVALSYIIAVFGFNAYNRSRNHEPWWISRLAAFRYFVVLHNVLLALFSFATFAAMFRAISRTWPGWVAEHPAASIADALCKIHGPRGLGDAATYNTTINIWEVKNALIKIGYDGNPDPTDVGRLWNEGLAFWGWVFYVSKFYEVIDTWIILAKGKRSATLQTYHHAGAMLCMWAGIRYMSPPIWMFVFINSGIHAMMYTYFTVAALGYKVPQGLKRTLTSLQIAQFVFGASYAALHLFVQYDIPVSTPYQIVSAVEEAVSSVSSAVSSFVEVPTASSEWINLAKKLLLRAAGEEGPAERIGMDRAAAITAIPQVTEQVPKVEKIVKQIFETRWRTDWTRVNCIDTSGEAFAIYLNLLYLAPLTWLFARFFVRAYLQRSRPRTASQAAREAASSAMQAKRETKDRIEKAGVKVEDEVAKGEVRAGEKGKDLREQVRKDVQAMREGKYGSSTAQRVSEQVSNSANKVEEVVESVVEQAKEGVRSLVNGSEDSAISNIISSINDAGESISTQVRSSIKETTEAVSSSVRSTAKEASDSISSSTEMFSSTTTDGANEEDTMTSSTEGKRPLAMPERRTPPQVKPPQTSPGMGLFRSPGVGDLEETDDATGGSAAAEAVASRIDDPFVTPADAKASLTTAYERSEDESVEKQDENISASLATRRPDNEQTSAAIPAQDQDAVLQSSQPIRPDPEDDSDAMGRSGVDVATSS